MHDPERLPALACPVPESPVLGSGSPRDIGASGIGVFQDAHASADIGHALVSTTTRRRSILPCGTGGREFEDLGPVTPDYHQGGRTLIACRFSASEIIVQPHEIMESGVDDKALEISQLAFAHRAKTRYTSDGQSASPVRSRLAFRSFSGIRALRVQHSIMPLRRSIDAPPAESPDG